MAAGRAGKNRLPDELSARAASGAAIFIERNRESVSPDLEEATSGSCRATSGRNDERDAENRSDIRLGEQEEHRMGHRAKTARSRLAAGDHLPERTPGARSKGPDHRSAGRRGFHVRRLVRRAN